MRRSSSVPSSASKALASVVLPELVPPATRMLRRSRTAIASMSATACGMIASFT
jgi:hypothetical protein